MLAATTAALGLAIAAPASPAGIQATAANAYLLNNQQGPAVAMEEATTCAPILEVAGERLTFRSAELINTAKTVSLYAESDTTCSNPVATLSSGSTTASGFQATRYTST